MAKPVVGSLALLVATLVASPAGSSIAPVQVCTVAGTLTATAVTSRVGYQWSLEAAGVCTRPNAIPRPTTISGRLFSECGFFQVTQTTDVPDRLAVGMRIGSRPTDMRVSQLWELSGPDYPIVAHRIRARRVGSAPSCTIPIGGEYGSGAMVGAPTAKHLDTLTLGISGAEYSWKVAATFAFET